MRGYRRVLFVAIAAALWPAAAAAQSQFTGLVTDESGAALPGVTVEISSPVLIEKVRSAVTDGTGRYTVVDLRPGTYRLAFTLPGFATSIRDAVELPTNFVATINVAMKIGSLEESITVSGATPTVDTQQAARTVTLARELIDALPTTRNIQSIGQMVPGVRLSAPDVGGERILEASAMRAHGMGEVRVVVRRIEHHDIEWSAGQGLFQRARRDVADDNTAIRLAAERGVLGDQPRGASIVVQARGGRGPAAQRLERHRTGAGERIEHAGAVDAVLQDVEQRLAQLIGRRTKAVPLRRFQVPALVRSRNDAHRSALSDRLSAIGCQVVSQP